MWTGAGTAGTGPRRRGRPGCPGWWGFARWPERDGPRRAGKALRGKVPRGAHAEVVIDPDRADPVASVEEFDRGAPGAPGRAHADPGRTGGVESLRLPAWLGRADGLRPGADAGDRYRRAPVRRRARGQLTRATPVCTATPAAGSSWTSTTSTRRPTAPGRGGLKRLGRRASRGRREGARRDERGHRGRHEGLPGDLAGADRAGGRRGRGEGGGAPRARDRPSPAPARPIGAVV